MSTGANILTDSVLISALFLRHLLEWIETQTLLKVEILSPALLGFLLFAILRVSLSPSLG